MFPGLWRPNGHQTLLLDFSFCSPLDYGGTSQNLKKEREVRARNKEVDGYGSKKSSVRGFGSSPTGRKRWAGHGSMMRLVLEILFERG